MCMPYCICPMSYILGKKFPYFPITHASHKFQDTQNTTDIYEDISASLKAGATLQEKILATTNVIPDNELQYKHLSLVKEKLTHFQPSENFNCFESMKQISENMEKSVEASAETGNELKLFIRKQKSLESSGNEHTKLQRSKSFQNLPGKQVFSFRIDFSIFVTSRLVEASKQSIAPNKITGYGSIEILRIQYLFLGMKCTKCDRFGASVQCYSSECIRIYHYPCAIVSGAIQNPNSAKMICPVHIKGLFTFGNSCEECNGSGDLCQLLLCTSCAKYYHGSCLKPPITPSPDVRAGWQCKNCKVCQNCRIPEESNKMLVCNICDKGYHAFCIKPPVSSIPKSNWKCSACRICGDCGARTPGNGPSSRWHLNYSVCDSCYQQRNKGVACPLCGKAYRQCSQRKVMKRCTVCLKYIHPECDRRTGMNSMNYVCPICINIGDKRLDESYVEHHIKDSFQGSSRDSFISGNDDTLSSEESDSYIEAKNKFRTATKAEKKRSSKPKFKSFPAVQDEVFYPMSAFLPKEYKTEDDDPTDDNKMVLTSATDEFVLCQEEGRLIACAQCGQCYHSYCASIKVTTIVLKKKKVGDV
ncbi:hypothetical protein CEXT_374931 [Caerostris extrusa]|uniref:PHD-type domain-containing protein n=1 Tax=Caerostris extrusa TaxID=172846 RepID=A0AAV4UAQ2_CAEEX|nr:hypothetical protein CEXT_374931 [Caerostris extrusa]